MLPNPPGTALDAVGSFWPAAHPEKCLPGRLTFDPRDGGRLEVVGTFHDQKDVIAKGRAKADGSVSVGPSELLGLDSPAIRIIGDTSDGPVTLDQCLGASGTYHVPLVLAGAHVLDSQPLRFQAGDFSIRHFVRWSGTSGLRPSLVVQDDPRRIEEVRIVHTPVPDTAVDVPHGQLVLHLPYTFRGDHVAESIVEQACTLELRFADPDGVADVLHAHHALQSLVSIAVAAPVRVTETRVRLVGGRWLQIHARGVGAGSTSGEVPTTSPGEMLFTYADLGGLDGIGRWLTKSKEFWPVVAALMSRWYAPDLYDELQFFNMVTAVEAFERIRQHQRQRRGKTYLEQALRTLVNLAGTPFRALVGDVDRWAKRVVRTRNEHVVHRGLRGDPDGESLYWLTGSVYALVVLCLLRECNVLDENMPSPERCPWMATVARKLRRDRRE